MATTGSAGTRLVILRGNSGSGKSSTARELRARLGRGVAWVEQDYLRRTVLREKDAPGGANIGLIDQTVRYALDCGYDVVLEGILCRRAGPPVRWSSAAAESRYCWCGGGPYGGCGGGPEPP